MENTLRIAWLNEDETSTTLLELLRRIFQALSKRYSNEFREADLEPIYDLDADTAERMLAQLLLDKLAGKTLLVALENLDALFEGLGKAGQQRLRAFIQEHPVLTIVATAQRLVDDITKRNSTFFGFFQTELLSMLSVEEAAELLGKIAALYRQDKAATFLRSSTGRSRVRALHHLSGGNHRIYLVLSQFITGDNIDSLVEPFAKMVDEMTPYYQERIRWLPPQQRKIIEFLCSRERPTPVKDMARRLFASQQTISSQLKDLREKGYVQSAQRGRESLYEIAEPLMRICVEVKENQSPGPMRLLVDFLRVWYDGEQLTNRLQNTSDGSAARNYLQAAIDKNSVLGNLRAQLLVEDFRNEFDDFQRETWLPLIESTVKLSEELAVACGELAKGNYKLGLIYLADIYKDGKNYPAQVIVTASALAATTYFDLDQFESGIQAVNTMCTQADVSSDMLAIVLNRRGRTYDMIGQTDKAIKDYSNVIRLTDAPSDQRAKAFLQRGIIAGRLGHVNDALADFNLVLKLKDIAPDLIAKAHYNKGVVSGVLEDYPSAVIYYSEATALPGLEPETLSNALYNRGLIYIRMDDQKHAEQDFTKIISLPNAPNDVVVDAYLALTLINAIKGYWQMGLRMLADGLSKLTPETKPEEAISTAIVTSIFMISLAPSIRKQQITELTEVYIQHNAATFLGDALIKHLASIHRNQDETPSPENLEQWISAWETAGQSCDGLRLPLRILRTGIDFLKAGSQDTSVLLDLNQEERQILVQALGLQN
ncbi:winged helix-turn-helix domain-containing protein [Methylomonas methanica]|uniref:winged helix-turn-helix domain-containing protein n=1 Tax=Methylomonas methanica TaxID=421 RepID=UPI001E5252B8|nr:winged helix-turn-helix domain-containing protein [Methylomonas methanica]